MGTTPTYFNTTKVDAKTLKKVKAETDNQDQVVADWYRRRKRPAGASHCYRQLITERRISRAVPLTSIRRSVNTLTRLGVLIKTDIKVSGEYGRDEFCWQFVPEVLEQPKQLRFA